MKNDANKTIIIVGAGPAGLALAISLRKIGLSVSIYEKRSRDQVIKGNNERSVNITLSKRGLTLLKQIGCVEKILKVTTKVLGRTYFIAEKSYFAPYTLLKDNFLYSIKRKDLEHLLIQVAEENGININFDFNLLGAVPNNKSCTFLHKGQIEKREFNFLFGADGINSKVRNSICAPHTLTETGDVYIRIEIDKLNAGRLNLNEKTVNIWPNPKGMLLSLPNKNKSHSGLMHIKRDTLDEIYCNPQLIESYFHILSKNIESFSDKFLQARVGSFGTIKCDRWFFNNNTLLIGDAAHAMVPFYGQGTNCGFEDVEQLCNFIKLNDNNLSFASAKFQEQRKNPTQAVSQLSLRNLKNLEVDQNFDEYLNFKNLDLALENKFNDYRSEYYLVAFSKMPYDRVAEISKANNKIIWEYSNKYFSEENRKPTEQILHELHSKLLNSNEGL